MSVTYSHIERQIALRISAFAGTVPAALDADYAVTPLTNAEYDSAIFTRDSVLDSMLNVEGRLADAIASTGSHPWRTFLKGVTGGIGNASEIPATDSLGNQIIGEYGSIYDSADLTVCREKSLAEIERRMRTGTTHVIPVYWFKLVDRRLYHTRPLVYVDVSVYNRATQRAAMLANAPMLLPDVLAGAMVAGGLSELFRDDTFTQQASQYRAYYTETEQGIRRGLASVNPVTIPSPTMLQPAA